MPFHCNISAPKFQIKRKERLIFAESLSLSHKEEATRLFSAFPDRHSCSGRYLKDRAGLPARGSQPLVCLPALAVTDGLPAYGDEFAQFYLLPDYPGITPGTLPLFFNVLVRLND